MVGDEAVRPGGRRPERSRGALWAPVLGLAAVVAAAVAAFGPADSHKAHYVWPPHALSVTPRQTLVAPFLVARRHAARLEVRLGCSLPQPLSGENLASGQLVLATTRRQSAGGLRLRLAGGRLVFELDGRLVDRFSWPPPAGGGRCGATLTVDQERWSYAGSGGERLASGDLSHAPIVNALLTGLDVRQPGLSVRVTTEVYGATTTLLQKAAGALAVLLAALALGFATAPVLRSRRLRRPVGAVLRAVRLVDIAVVASLGVWWIVGPAFFDDGWVRVRQQNYAAAGSFVEYFIGWGGVLPGEYWLDWLDHWLVGATGSVPLLRLVPLAAGVAGWAVCRWALGRVIGQPEARRRVVLSTMAVTYLAAFGAWGMTLRPEPVIALLAVGALGAISVFVQRPSIGPLAVVGILAALALTAHPTGIVVLAPLLAVSPRVVTWARREGAVLSLRLGAVALASVALAAVLLFVHSDVSLTRRQAALARSLSAHSGNWRDELNRYTLLSAEDFATPLRRLAVALLLLVVVAFLTRSRRDRRPLEDLPALSVVLALALLTITPSKWPWHFGALIGLGAVALATEVGRLADEGRRSNRRLGLRPAGAIVLVLAGNAWAWAPLGSWVALDLHTLHWSRTAGMLVRLGSHVTLGSLKQWVVFLAIVVTAAVVCTRWRQGRWAGGDALWRLSLWIVVVVAVPTMLYTAAYFVRDTQRSDGWTLTRQNLDSLRGRSTCGLGEALTVPQPASIRALRSLGRSSDAGSASLVQDGVLPRGSRPPFGRPQVWGSWAAPESEGPLVTPWFAVPAARDSTGIGIYVSGSFTGRDGLVLEWGSQNGRSVEPGLRTSVTIPPLAADQAWTLIPSRLLPPRPAGADAVRIVAEAHDAPGSWFGVSGPVSYRRETIAAEIKADPSSVLVTPTLLLYFPCASTPPRVAAGVAETPRTFVLWLSRWPLVDESSPFSGILDVDGVFALPLDDRRWNPAGVGIYVTKPLPAGESLLPPERD